MSESDAARELDRFKDALGPELFRLAETIFWGALHSLEQEGLDPKWPEFLQLIRSLAEAKAGR